MLKKDKADLLHRTPKIITTSLRWQLIGGDRYRLDTRVLAPLENEVLKLSCNVGKSNYGFSLLYQNHPVRKYTKHFQHTSRSTGEKFIHPHKHTWDEETEDDKAFIPSDIDPATSIDDQLLAFLAEENIEPQGGYQRLLLR
jgi:hypothetical protein